MGRNVVRQTDGLESKAKECFLSWWRQAEADKRDLNVRKRSGRGVCFYSCTLARLNHHLHMFGTLDVGGVFGLQSVMEHR